MIFAKNIKTKRLHFILLMIAEELILTSVFKYNIWFQVLYTAFTYMILRNLYGDKAQVTDVFTFIISSIIMLVVNAIVYGIVCITIKEFIVYAIVSRIILFGLLFFVRYKLYNITKLYDKLWNRHDNIPKKIKTTTFRSINIVIFNITFYLVHLILLFEMTRI